MELKGEHRIEDGVIVRLEFDAESGQWKIDGSTLDGASLDSAFASSPFNDECPCDDKEECEQIQRRALRTDYPDAEQLCRMLNTALRH